MLGALAAYFINAAPPPPSRDIFGVFFFEILTKYVKNGKIHVDNFQERHFLRINEKNAKNIAGGGSALIKYAAKAPSIHTKLQPIAGRR